MTHWVKQIFFIRFVYKINEFIRILLSQSDGNSVDLLALKYKILKNEILKAILHVNQHPDCCPVYTIKRLQHTRRKKGYLSFWNLFFMNLESKI